MPTLTLRCLFDVKLPKKDEDFFWSFFWEMLKSFSKLKFYLITKMENNFFIFNKML